MLGRLYLFKLRYSLYICPRVGLLARTPKSEIAGLYVSSIVHTSMYHLPFIKYLIDHFISDKILPHTITRIILKIYLIMTQVYIKSFKVFYGLQKVHSCRIIKCLVFVPDSWEATSIPLKLPLSEHEMKDSLWSSFCLYLVSSLTKFWPNKTAFLRSLHLKKISLNYFFRFILMFVFKNSNTT